MDLQMNAIRQLLAAMATIRKMKNLLMNFPSTKKTLYSKNRSWKPLKKVEQPVETVPSQKSNLKLVYDRHLFVFQKWNIDRTKKFWKCDKYEADGCPKRLHTDVMNRVISQVSEHNHETNPARIGVHRVKESLRTRATLQWSGFVLPLLYVLLPNKSEACYMKMFEMVKNLWPRFQPTSASLDYEMGLINAVKESFVGSRLVLPVPPLKEYEASPGKHRKYSFILVINYF
uniref:FLYWCH-type domain-containing protein n=1 Tax=Ditylenchus dipsaci TaxID=166011 RepID=A0A915DPN2_9BILA